MTARLFVLALVVASMLPVPAAASGCSDSALSIEGEHNSVPFVPLPGQATAGWTIVAPGELARFEARFGSLRGCDCARSDEILRSLTTVAAVPWPLETEPWRASAEVFSRRKELAFQGEVARLSPVDVQASSECDQVFELSTEGLRPGDYLVIAALDGEPLGDDASPAHRITGWIATTNVFRIEDPSTVEGRRYLVARAALVSAWNRKHDAAMSATAELESLCPGSALAMLARAETAEAMGKRDVATGEYARLVRRLREGTTSPCDTRLLQAVAGDQSPMSDFENLARGWRLR